MPTIRAATMAAFTMACLLVGPALAAELSGSAGASTPEHPSPSRVTASAGCRVKAPLASGVHTESLLSGGLQRLYQLEVPADYTGKKPFALVLGLHPLSVSYTYMPSVVRFSTNAPKYDFIGVAPSGLLSSGTPYWDAAPTAQNYDVTFIAALIDHLESRLCINTSEVFSTGISNGAQMSSLLGCRLRTKITAIAPVEGEEYLTPCRGKPEPILAFHGTADPVLPYGGGGLNATRIAGSLLFPRTRAGRVAGPHGHRPLHGGLGPPQWLSPPSEDRADLLAGPKADLDRLPGGDRALHRRRRRPWMAGTAGSRNGEGVRARDHPDRRDEPHDDVLFRSPGRRRQTTLGSLRNLRPSFIALAMVASLVLAVSTLPTLRRLL